jgi:hypothetical protein
LPNFGSAQLPAKGFVLASLTQISFVYATAYVGNSAVGFGERVRTAIQLSLCGANRGWSFALNFCFFLFKQKEKKKNSPNR